jgi:hypothetical protein
MIAHGSLCLEELPSHATIPRAAVRLRVRREADREPRQTLVLRDEETMKMELEMTWHAQPRCHLIRPYPRARRRPHPTSPLPRRPCSPRTTLRRRCRQPAHSLRSGSWRLLLSDQHSRLNEAVHVQDDKDDRLVQFTPGVSAHGTFGRGAPAPTFPIHHLLSVPSAELDRLSFRPVWGSHASGPVSFVLLLLLSLLLLQLPRTATENGYRDGHRPARPSILVVHRQARRDPFVSRVSAGFLASRWHGVKERFG